MSEEISKEDLKKEINSILKISDLSVVSAKKVREQVEKKFNCSLIARKKEFDSIVMEFINAQQESESEEEEEAAASASEEEQNSSEEDTKKKPKKRPQPTQRKAAAPKKKRKTLNASDSGTESDGGSDSDFELPKKTPVKKKGGAGTGTGRKSTGFTRAYALSPELSELMGAESLPRHEVVKKVWAIIKERNLYDPKNKQFAICDAELLKVMKVKRFRTFGMLKHLKQHFIN